METGTDPTRPTPPPVPALPPPAALAPMVAPVALVVPGGWQIEGLPATVRHAGPQAEVDDLFQHALEMRISEAADQNTKNNDRRSDRLELDTDLSGEPVSWVVQD